MHTENCLLKDRKLIEAMETLAAHLAEGYIPDGLSRCKRCRETLERQRAMLVHCELEAVKNQLNHLLCEVSSVRRTAAAEGTCCAALH